MEKLSWFLDTPIQDESECSIPESIQDKLNVPSYRHCPPDNDFIYSFLHFFSAEFPNKDTAYIHVQKEEWMYSGAEISAKLFRIRSNIIIATAEIGRSKHSELDSMATILPEIKSPSLYQINTHESKQTGIARENILFLNAFSQFFWGEPLYSWSAFLSLPDAPDIAPIQRIWESFVKNEIALPATQKARPSFIMDTTEIVREKIKEILLRPRVK